MANIELLNEETIDKIAAGEVVERPASIVKELVENAIDAHATALTIEVKEGGISFIRVTDNGDGIARDQVKKAFYRHATSKLKSVEDLETLVSLGFRGEALSSIAAVSQVEMMTKTKDELIGTRYVTEGAVEKEFSEIGVPNGTTIIVRNVFFNTPARRKFLKTANTELGYISDICEHLALSVPNVSFKFVSGGQLKFNTSGDGDLKEVIYRLYGKDVASEMIPIEHENKDIRLKGYLGKPVLNRSNRNFEKYFINGRFVKSNMIAAAAEAGYKAYLMQHKFPFFVLDIKVNTSAIDVNVHPTKMDINFYKFDELKLLVTNMINKAIKNINLIPEIEAKEKVYPKVERYTLDLNIEEPEIKYEEKEVLIINNDLISIEEKEEEQALETEKMPKMYPVGEVHGTYIVAENDTGMYLIDQHAAKERINYEIVKERLSNPNNESMDMIVPLTLEFTNNEYIILKENINLLLDMGFKIEEFGINSIIVKSHPTWLGGPYTDTINECIKNIIDMVIEKEKNFDLSRFRDHVAATTACKMSIKANNKITLDEMNKLLEDLRKCKNPFNCPHGRPTVIFYSTDELEKLFKRSGF